MIASKSLTGMPLKLLAGRDRGNFELKLRWACSSKSDHVGKFASPL
jgi:hypothetical protein